MQVGRKIVFGVDYSNKRYHVGSKTIKTNHIAKLFFAAVITLNRMEWEKSPIYWQIHTQHVGVVCFYFA